MNFLSRLTLTICVLSIIYTALMMLVPDRFRREIRSVIALVAAVTAGAMLLSADFSDISQELGSLSFEQSNASYERMVQDELEARLCEYVSSFLGEDGVECKNLSVRTTIDEQNRISITEASLKLDRGYSEREDRIRGLIEEKIGDIEVKISYEDE